MARTIHFYNVYITKNGKKTDIHFTDLIDKMIVIPWLDRLRMINEAPMVLFSVKTPESLNRTIAIGRYRQDVKPYIGDMAIEKADMITQDIIEMVTCVIVPQYKTAIIEFNMYGSKIKDISDYFNSFLQSTSENWSVEFEPIDSERSLRDVQESKDIRKVEIKLNLHGGLKNRFLQMTVQDKPQSLLGTIFNSAKELNETLDASIISLSFAKGRKKVDIMDAAEIIKLIEVLDIESDVIQSLRVRYTNTKTGKVEDLDLKYVGILKDFLDISDASSGWEYIGDKIEELYKYKNSPGSIAFTKKGYSFVVGILPLLASTPEEKFRVLVEKGSREENAS